MRHTQTPSAISSDPEYSEKMGIITAAIHREENQDEHFDPDIEGAEAPKRPFLLMHAAVIGFAMTLVVFVEMLCVAKVGIALRFMKKSGMANIR
jgi:hypothetical protein